MSYPNLMVIHELLQDYVVKRIEDSKSWFGALDTAFSSLAGKANSFAGIDGIRQEFKKDCSEAHEANTNEAKAIAWTEIIIKLGAKALHAQALTNNHSHLCETLHAMRSYILKHTENFPELAEAINKRKRILQEELINKTSEITNEKTKSNDSKNKIEALTQEKYLILQQLAYLGDTKTLIKESDQLKIIFPSLEYPKRPSSNSLTSKDKNTLYDLPYVLQESYIQHYIDRYFNKLGLVLSLQEVERALTAEVCKKYGMNPQMALRAYEYMETSPANDSQHRSSASSISPLTLTQQQATPRIRENSNATIFSAISGSSSQGSPVSMTGHSGVIPPMTPVLTSTNSDTNSAAELAASANASPKKLAPAVAASSVSSPLDDVLALPSSGESALPNTNAPNTEESATFLNGSANLTSFIHSDGSNNNLVFFSPPSPKNVAVKTAEHPEEVVKKKKKNKK